MVLDTKINQRLKRIIKEQRQRDKIQAYGLSPRRKLLLLGPPGTGKTMTASTLAGELSFPLFIIRMDGLINKFMGETSAKLRIVFDAVKQHKGVYLFDEFDSIGSTRNSGNDVGEIRRILNSFLQYIEVDDSDSIILAATNHPEILDNALIM
jgi:SpoVK/Ycf46/Vps4 family AAA+-type ATPase